MAPFKDHEGYLSARSGRETRLRPVSALGGILFVLILDVDIY